MIKLRAFLNKPIKPRQLYLLILVGSFIYVIGLFPNLYIGVRLGLVIGATEYILITRMEERYEKYILLAIAGNSLISATLLFLYCQFFFGFVCQRPPLILSMAPSSGILMFWLFNSLMRFINFLITKKGKR